jgi:F0F1-type ATP synthase beta subunit
VTKELNRLKNEKTTAAKKKKASERRCMVDDNINECDCDRLRSDFTALRSTYQQRQEIKTDVLVFHLS